MLVNKALHLSILALSLLWDSKTDAASTTFKLCGRKLGEFMSRVCHVYNSPPWAVPTVVEQPAAAVRRKRQIGIADQCCTLGCTIPQLNEYCAISAISESPLDSMEAHLIADRSAEEAASSPAMMASYGREEREEREEREGREGREGREAQAQEGAARREDILKNAARAAPVVGTVSPLLTWGRTLNTDLPSLERDRYAYVAVYT